MVLVSHARQFIFLKTQKTAGTTIEMALEPYCRPKNSIVTEKTQAKHSRVGIVGRRLCEQNKLKKLLGFADWYSHMPAATVRELLGDKRWRQYRKISSVRNPFDAAVSLFYWRLAQQNKSVPTEFSEVRQEFKQMLRANDWSVSYRATHIDDRMVIDDVVRFENLENDLAKIVEKIAPGDKLLNLPVTKKTSHKKIRPTIDYFDDETIGIVRKGADWVFEHFSYPLSPTELAKSDTELRKFAK